LVTLDAVQLVAKPIEPHLEKIVEFACGAAAEIGFQGIGDDCGFGSTRLGRQGVQALRQFVVEINMMTRFHWFP
jgi:hypothetical protein